MIDFDIHKYFLCYQGSYLISLCLLCSENKATAVLFYVPDICAEYCTAYIRDIYGLQKNFIFEID